MEVRDRLAGVVDGPVVPSGLSQLLDVFAIHRFRTSAQLEGVTDQSLFRRTDVGLQGVGSQLPDQIRILCQFTERRPVVLQSVMTPIQ